MKRIWLIGNGPSLLKTPLSLLREETTMGLNAISMIYDKTDWRPKFYFCMDVNPNDRRRWKSIEDNLKCERLFLWEKWKDRYPYNNIEWLPLCKKHHPFPVQSKNALQEWHFPSICSAHGSMSPMMQLAVQMGYEEIYLVGVDLFTQKHDHFDSLYPSYAKWEERNKIEVHIHEVAKRSSPVPIVNCTVGGLLEVHPRKSVEEVLGLDLVLDQNQEWVRA